MSIGGPHEVLPPHGASLRVIRALSSDRTHASTCHCASRTAPSSNGRGRSGTRLARPGVGGGAGPAGATDGPLLACRRMTHHVPGPRLSDLHSRSLQRPGAARTRERRLPEPAGGLGAERRRT